MSFETTVSFPFPYSTLFRYKGRKRQWQSTAFWGANFKTLNGSLKRAPASIRRPLWKLRFLGICHWRLRTFWKGGFLPCGNSFQNHWFSVGFCKGFASKRSIRIPGRAVPLGSDRALPWELLPEPLVFRWLLQGFRAKAFYQNPRARGPLGFW